MPRVPKNVPGWLPAFIMYARTKERKGDNKRALDVFETVLEARWTAFAEHMAENQPEPKPRKPADPLKSMNNAMKKVAQEMEQASQNPAQFQEIRNKVLESTPGALKDVYQPQGAPAAVNDDVVQRIHELCDQTTACKQSLEQKLKDNGGVADQATHEAMNVVNSVCSGLESIRDTLGNTGDEEEDEEDAAAAEDDEEGDEKQDEDMDVDPLTVV
jgi:hypothetical protein